MGTVAIIACDHGYGHVRRCLLIGAGLAEAGHHVNLFAPVASVARFPVTHDRLRVVDFATCTSASGWRAGNPACTHWHQRLPPLDGFRLVVSDNLPEILETRPDAVLSGGFLWHQALPDMAGAAAERAAELLARHQPPMVTSAMFAAPELLEATRATTVGLLTDRPRPDFDGQDLLIACGGSGESEPAFARAVAELAQGPHPKAFPSVWVEPRLMPAGAPQWMRPAKFGPALYRQLAACVCRPGIGTVSDCLWAGARVFSAHEDGNGEMTFNARRLAEAGVGTACANPAEAIAAAIAHANCPEARQAHGQAASAIDFNGIRQTVAMLSRLAD